MSMRQEAKGLGVKTLGHATVSDCQRKCCTGMEAWPYVQPTIGHIVQLLRPFLLQLCLCHCYWIRLDVMGVGVSDVIVRVADSVEALGPLGDVLLAVLLGFHTRKRNDNTSVCSCCD